jgi:hypothetical protein
VRLEELFTMDVEAAVKEFSARCAAQDGPHPGEIPVGHLLIIQDPEYKRLGCR